MPSKYDNYDWDELPADAKKHAETLGYTKEIWDADKEPELLKDSDWDDLNDDQKAAATFYGYDKEKWDSED